MMNRLFFYIFKIKNPSFNPLGFQTLKALTISDDDRPRHAHDHGLALRG
jgi:hypothetical protein